MDEITQPNQIKSTTKKVLVVVTMFLMLFPFINTFNQFLVKIFEFIGFFEPLTNILVGYEARLVRLFLGLLSIQTRGNPSSPIVTLVGREGGLDPVAIAWGCVGWQSMVLVGTTLFTGLQGNYSLASKLEALATGILVTFWINVFRITVIFYLYYHFGQTRALFFHDYGSIILTIVWLFIFWYYTFNFVLQRKT